MSVIRAMLVIAALCPVSRVWANDQVMESIGRFQEHPTARTANELRRVQDSRALPALRQAFNPSSGDRLASLAIASALVALRDNDDEYLQFLISRASASIETPSPMVIEETGHTLKANPDFVAWSRAHPEYPSPTDAMILVPAAMADLAATGDRRAYPTFVAGLSSPNPAIAHFAALGLAKIQDQRAIKLIIAAAERHPGEPGQSIANALVYFKEAEAQAGAARLIENKKLLKLWREAADKSGPAGILN